MVGKIRKRREESGSGLYNKEGQCHGRVMSLEALQWMLAFTSVGGDIKSCIDLPVFPTHFILVYS